MVIEVKLLNSQGGFPLRNFLKSIPRKDVFADSFVMRDDLHPLPKHGPVPTKREVVKVVMTLFGPLWLNSFLLIHGKILIQYIWVRCIDWDDISKDLYERLLQWTVLLTKSDLLHFPGCYFRCAVPENPNCLQIHIFCYANVAAFWRSLN